MARRSAPWRIAQSIPVAVTIVFALATPSPAAEGACGTGPIDEAAIDGAIYHARTACPCDAFAKPRSYRACFREVVDDLIAAEAMRMPCRQVAMRWAPEATSEDDCDAFDIPGQLDCEFFVACNQSTGGFDFPYCIALP